MELRLSAVRFAPWLLLATLSVSSALPAAAQEDDRLGWSGEAEANANLFFGNTGERTNFAEAGDFTASSATSLAYELSEILSATLSLVDDHDSEARSRGARSNSDGQLLFGLLASF